MVHRSIERRVLLGLVTAALVLIVTAAVVLALAAILGLMGDSPASLGLQGIALVLGVLLAVDLFFLVLVTAMTVWRLLDAGTTGDESQQPEADRDATESPSR